LTKERAIMFRHVRCVAYSLMFLAICWPAACSGQDWPRFRGPGGMGISAATDLPVEWGPSHGLVWKTALPGAGASSPITFGDRIFLTCYTGFFVPGESGGSPEQLQRHLIALRLDDGQVVWEKAVAARLPEEERVRDHGFAANSVAVDADRVYAFFGKTGVFAFDHEGHQLWQTDVGSQTSGWGTAASPVLYKDLVLINASVESESLVALDRATGAEKWRAGGIREAWNTPLVVTAASGREELIVPVQGSVLAFDPDSGEPLWSCKTDIGWYMVPSVVAADGVIYCLGGRSGTAALAIRAGGRGDVTQTHRLWTSVKGSNVSSPVYLDGHLYWAHESREIAYCVKGATGEVVYERRLDRAGQFYASALLADGRLYYVNRDGKTFVLAAKPQFEQLAVNDLSDRSVFNASPAVVGNRLLLRSDKYLYCVGK
jgi:outer membrane protein assembly factor BamB